MLMDLEDAYDLTCLIDKPTRVTLTTETLIDVLLPNKPETFVLSGILNPGLSDHALIYSIDDKYHYWSGLLSYIIDEHVPIKRKRVRTKDVPYMTKKWIDAIRVKRKAAKQFAKEKTPANWEIKRNEATQERRIAIKAF